FFFFSSLFFLWWVKVYCTALGDRQPIRQSRSISPRRRPPSRERPSVGCLEEEEEEEGETDVETDVIEALYEELQLLGSGGLGKVFAGYRREDRLPEETDIPLEVHLMQSVGGCEGPGAPVLLLDWFHLGQELVLVQERPVPFVDLLTYMQSKEDPLQEQEAKMILRHVVEGILRLHSSGVLHRDIKAENILLRPALTHPASASSPGMLLPVPQRDVIEALYEELEQLGAGGYGRVYAGYRREDRLPEEIEVLLEVYLMLCAESDGGCERPGAPVLLLDWFHLSQELVLVLERPVHFVDLCTYLESKEGPLQEQDAKMILRHVVEGILRLQPSGVLHRDIKAENILIEAGSATPRVCIINLGCCCQFHSGMLSLQKLWLDAELEGPVASSLVSAALPRRRPLLQMSLKVGMEK
ncbi:hypothetical protein CRUP_007787, partial [Coryphaenoides rupestris]